MHTQICSRRGKSRKGGHGGRFREIDNIKRAPTVVRIYSSDYNTKTIVKLTRVHKNVRILSPFETPFPSPLIILLCEGIW